ncbi:Hypothetical_protein [Hexamita inflata]|uniref:Hypothetical_protein n=1 Tax=Hexamita inflata TaxID=28002 RepID=A0AA86R0C9_9EUKA|nr:Hypothetical protein HINF_LOCUS56974 [Hexamita inflata]
MTLKTNKRSWESLTSDGKCRCDDYPQRQTSLLTHEHNPTRPNHEQRIHPKTRNPLSTNYEVHTSQIHPIILSDQCTIHPESSRKLTNFCRVDKFYAQQPGSIIKSHGNRTRIYNEAVKQHAEELQLQFTYADNHDIFYEEFQNRDSDNVVISHDLGGTQLLTIKIKLKNEQEIN